MTFGNERQTREAPGELSPSQAGVPLPGRYGFLLSLFIASLFIAARLWRLTASCLWFDEIFSVHASRHSWTSLLHFVAADIIHPPLFYALLKVWITIGGESLLWLRLFPALTSVFTIVPFYLVSQELRLKQGELNLALLLMAVNGYLIKYAQELRMYSLLLFFSLCSLWLFVKFLNSNSTSKKQLLALFAVNLLLVYTHYSGWLLVMLEALLLVVYGRQKLRTFLVTVVGLILAYLPWVYEIVVAAEPGRALEQNIGWVIRPGLRELAEYVVLLNRPFVFSQSNIDALNNRWTTVIVLLLIGIPLLAFCWRVYKPHTADDSERVQMARWLLIFSFAPVLFGFVLSCLLPYSIWGTRHLIIAAGPYSILVALALKHLRRDWARITIFLLLGCWFVLSGLFIVLRRPPIYVWCAWEQLGHQLMLEEQNPSEVVRVYTHEDLIAYHLWFALNTPEGQRFKVVLVKGVPGVPNDAAYFLPRDFTDISTQDGSAITDGEIWLAFRAERWDEARSPLKLWLQKGYQVNRVFSNKAQGQQAFLVELKRNQISRLFPDRFPTQTREFQLLQQLAKVSGNNDRTLLSDLSSGKLGRFPEREGVSRE